MRRLPCRLALFSLNERESNLREDDRHLFWLARMRLYKEIVRKEKKQLISGGF